MTTDQDTTRRLNVRAAFASRPRPGEARNGDAAFVRHEGSTLLFAVLDGLGHGDAAADATDAGVEFLAAVDLGLSLHDIVTGLDAHLSPTCGAGAVVGVVRHDTLLACCIADVAVRGHGVAVPLIPSGGLLGRRAGPLHTCGATLPPGARVLVFTPGVAAALDLADVAGHAPQDACQALLAQHAVPEDDATVMLLEATDDT